MRCPALAPGRLDPGSSASEARLPRRDREPACALCAAGGEGALVPVPVARELLLGGVELVFVLLDDEPALDECVDLTDAFEHDAGLDLQPGLP